MPAVKGIATRYFRISTKPSIFSYSPIKVQGDDSPAVLAREHIIPFFKRKHPSTPLLLLTFGSGTVESRPTGPATFRKCYISPPLQELIAEIGFI
jgi:hypothetical protein